MKLALAMGRLDVDALAAELSSDQLNEWMAYDRIEPFGGDRADIHAALIQHSQYLMQAGGKGKLKVSDFMPRFGASRRRRETAKEVSHRLRAGFAVAAATFKGGGSQ
jgi:hypothetical protein